MKGRSLTTINVQAVCDNELRITNPVAKWPGSSHDSYIWRTSGLRRQFEDSRI